MTERNLKYVGLILAAGFIIGWFGKSFASAKEVLPGSPEDPLVSRAYVDSKLKFKVVELGPGKIVTGYSGTEIILRAGQATVIDSELGGLADVTAGRDLRFGQEVPNNHLLVVPRDDGRGIHAVSPIIILVRGNYTIK